MRYKSLVISRLGGPEVLEVREEELPEPGLGEVRVRSGYRRFFPRPNDARRGTCGGTAPPFTPGWDLVGVVDKLGVGASAVETRANGCCFADIGS